MECGGVDYSWSCEAVKLLGSRGLERKLTALWLQCAPNKVVIIMVVPASIASIASLLRVGTLGVTPRVCTLTSISVVHPRLLLQVEYR